MYPVNTSSIIDTTDGMKTIKESMFSDLRPIDGVTRLKLYNYSNITGLENLVHKGGQVVVEIPNGCLILRTGDTYHVEIGIFHIADGSYSSNLRFFSCIVKKKYITVNEDIASIQQQKLSISLSYL